MNHVDRCVIEGTMIEPILNSAQFIEYELSRSGYDSPAKTATQSDEDDLFNVGS
jgi:hypothetical protein